MNWKLSREEEGLSKSVQDKVSNFAFEKGELDDSQYLDMRSDIDGKHMFQAVFFYRVLQECYGSNAAGRIADILERLSLSKSRMSRKEAVTTLIGGKFQRPEEIMRGTEEGLKETQK